MAPEDVLPEATLDSLPQALQDACARAGWDKLMPVQALAMPYLLAGRDLMIQSRTGSGKTGVFVLPIMDRVNTALDQCQALVLVPTRELAQQVAREAETLAAGTGMRVAAVYGGAGYGPQLDALRQGAHLVVGTPGRVLDHLMRGSLSLQGIEVLVFDEADRMLSIGFYPDMREVQRYLPGRKVTMLMTSATYPPHVMRLAGEFMERPQLLSLSHKRVHVAETPHLYYECKPMEKDRALVRIIEMENPASAFIFCNTKQNVHYVTAVLQRFGYDADELSGDLTQVKREQVLDRIRRGKLRFLVATDVAARGIDIPDLSHVFLYEPPEDHEVYIHRAGRTGRAGASGEVVSLVDVMEKLALHRIGKMYKISLEARLLPTDEDVQKAIAQRMTALLEGRLRKLDNVERERIERFKLLAKTLAEGEGGVDLVAMLLDETYRAELQGAPPKPPAREQAPKARAPREDRRRDRGDEPAPREAAPREAAAAPEAEAPQAQPAGEDGEAPAPKKRRRRRRKKKKPAEGAEAAGNGAAPGPAPEGDDDGPDSEGWDHDEDEDDGPSPGQNWSYDEH
nr:DEAD/DEAH box helicase [Desulfocurvus vexinensis]